MSLEHVLSMIEEHKVRYIDLRFTDTRGKEQHITIPAHQVNDDFFEEGKIKARPSGFNKSNAVTSIAKSNGVIVLPGGTRGFTSGDAIKVMLTDVTTGTDTFGVE